MNRMARYQLLRNRGDNEDADAAFHRFAMLHRQHAQDANPRGNDLDLMMAPFANLREVRNDLELMMAPFANAARVAREGVREARCERVTVRGNVLRSVSFYSKKLYRRFKLYIKNICV